MDTVGIEPTTFPILESVGLLDPRDLRRGNHTPRPSARFELEGRGYLILYKCNSLVTDYTKINATGTGKETTTYVIYMFVVFYVYSFLMKYCETSQHSALVMR